MTLGGEIARARKAFYNPMLKKNPVTMTQSAKTAIAHYQS